MPMIPLSVRDAYNIMKTLCGFATPAGDFIPSHSLDCSRATYRFAASFTPFATGPVTLFQVKGSATKTVRVKRIRVSGVSTANASVLCKLQRTTSTGTGGTAVTPTPGKNDPLSVAASAVVTHYTTASQSAGAAADGPLSFHRLYTGVVTTPTLGQELNDIFPENAVPVGQALVLRGASDCLEYQLSSGNLSAGTVLEYVVELEEDAS